MSKSKPNLSRPPRGDADAFIDAAGKPANTTDEALPWENPSLRRDVLRTFNLRLPEPTKAKLQWLAEQGPESMHQIAVEAVEAEIERRIREYTG